MEHLNPIISIIIPVYNVEQFLRECLDSVVNQTLRNIEIICVNDGSTDKSLAILEEYRKKDSRITVISQENRGPSAARNRGMQHARGEYIYFIDSDDYIELDALEKASQIATKNHLDVILFGREVFYESEEMAQRINFKYKTISKATEIITGYEYMRMANEQGIVIMTVWCALWRHAFLRDNEITFKEGIIHEDNLFNFQAFMAAERVARIPDKFYHRRFRANSIMTRPESAQNAIGYFACAEGALTYALRDVYPLEKEYEIWRQYTRNLKSAKRIYASLPSKEKEKVVFPGRVETELFRQTVISECELNRTKQELNQIKQELNKTKQELRYTKKNLEQAEKDLSHIRIPASFRIRRAVTWVPRKTRDIICCFKKQNGRVGQFIVKALKKPGKGIRYYQEHGLRDTINHTKINLHQKQKESFKKDYAYYNALPPKKYPKELKLWYKRVMNQNLNLDHPQTINEKIQWLKLYDATPLKTKLADKYLVRDWVKEKIGEEYLIPLLGIWDSFEEIDFDQLPEKFVLKANHGSGWNVIVKDKSQFDREAAKEKFDKWLKTNYAFVSGFELQYLNIPPKIIAEQYLEKPDQLIDYKVWCSDGKARFIWVDTDRFTNHKRTLFSLDWERLPITIVDRYFPDERELPRPKNLEKMIRFAEIMCEDFAQVRVDFFEVNDKLYFGEMTFTSGSGKERTRPREFEYEMGNWVTLPQKSPIPIRQQW